MSSSMRLSPFIATLRVKRDAKEPPGSAAPWRTVSFNSSPLIPKSEGIVERMNTFLETSFIPGRQFEHPDDLNTRLAAWLVRANRRTVRSPQATPTQLIELDRKSMLALPPVDPQTGFRNRMRVGRDYYTRVLGNGYSVDAHGDRPDGRYQRRPGASARPMAVGWGGD